MFYSSLGVSSSIVSLIDKPNAYHVIRLYITNAPKNQNHPQKNTIAAPMIIGILLMNIKISNRSSVVAISSFLFGSSDK